MEIFKDIKGYEKYYQVSNCGNIKSIKRIVIRSINTEQLVLERILKPQVNESGYLFVTLCKNKRQNKFLIHRLVAKTFILNINNKPEINHIDGNKKNNNINNLEWCTSSENQLHAFKIGLQKPTWLGKFGENHNKSKSIIQLDINRNVINKFNGIREASRITKIDSGAISRASSNKLKTAGGFLWEKC